MARRRKTVDWDKLVPIMGVWTDASIARVYDVDPGVVTKQRNKRGIPRVPNEIATSALWATKSRALDESILSALWAKQPSSSSEIARRVENNYGTIEQRTVIRHLRALVKKGLVLEAEKDHQMAYVKKG